MRVISFVIRSDSFFRMTLRLLDTFFSKLEQWEQKRSLIQNGVLDTHRKR